MISYFVTGVAEHEHDLLTALGNAAKADSKSVSAEDWENNTHGAAAQLVFHILCKLISSCIILLSSGQN